jgi:hypothetical protein
MLAALAIGPHETAPASRAEKNPDRRSFMSNLKTPPGGGS